MYQVPIIPADLRHEETIIQAANALDYLQNTINDLFDKIDKRIETNNNKITELKQRINLANKKIHSLIGINKAIKIFSPSKFPASHILFTDIPQTFNEFEITKKLQINNEYSVKSSQEPVTQKLIQDKLQFYHVRSKNKSKLINILEQKRGLGPIPRHLTSINSLLLYNTSENVYYDSYGKDMDALLNRKQIEMMTINSGGAKGNELTTKLSDRLEAPPISMTNRLYNDKRINQQGLFYTPKLNEAPEMDVPLDLPDLPGIADDVIFDVTENEKIAPSMFLENLPELPEPIINTSESEELEKNVVNTLKDDSSKVDVTHQQTPPPPPPPLPSDNSEIPSVLPPPPPPTSMLPSPPPPPPPPPPPLPADVLLSLTASELPSKSVPSPERPKEKSLNTGDAHMNLMEAIRQAGGAKGGKLRAAADVVTRAKDTTSKNNASVAGGNLMADLHNRLSMRRKGISGSKDQEDGGTGNNNRNSNTMISGRDLLTKISATLPPPELNSNSSADGSDSDWADNE